MPRGQSLEVVSESTIACGDCVGACCQNVHLVLSGAERSRLEEAGTSLFPLLPIPELDGNEVGIDWSLYSDEFERRAQSHEDPEVRKVYAMLSEVSSGMQPGEGYFAMEGRCGNLTADNECGDYANRPSVCQKFDMGSIACIAMRLNVADRFDAQMERFDNQLVTD